MAMLPFELSIRPSVTVKSPFVADIPAEYAYCEEQASITAIDKIDIFVLFIIFPKMRIKSVYIFHPPYQIVYSK